MSYKSYNAYYDGYWPDDWDDEDIEFLAGFLREEFDARLVDDLSADEPTWTLYVKEERDD